MKRALLSLAALIVAPVAAWAQPAPSQPPSETSGAAGDATAVKVPEKLAGRTDFQLTLTTLEALRKKGTISEEEYRAALQDLIAVGTRAKAEPTFVVGRFTTTLYGFLQGDVIHDTQRFTSDSAGNATLNLPGTRAGDLGRTVMEGRGTRLGLRFGAPAFHRIRVSGNFEMDFLGNQPGAPPRGSSVPPITEAAFFTQPTPRLRHGIVKVDTDYVTLWVGQTWNLMAFQPAYLPTSVQFQGLPGQLFGRTPQFRLSHLFDARSFSLEIAAAALRPPQFDSEIPDLQAGIKLNVNGWTGIQTIGSTGTTVSPASVAVTGATRTFKLATSLTTNDSASVTGNIVAVNALLPIIPAKERGGFSFVALAGLATGTGTGDLYTRLDGGLTNLGRPSGIPAAPPPPAVDPYLALVDIDLGMAAFTTTGALKTIDWQTMILSGEIHAGPAILAGSFGNVVSGNIDQFVGNPWYHEWWWDAVAMADIAPGFRMGAEFSRTLQRRVSGAAANNSRLMLTGWFLF